MFLKKGFTLIELLVVIAIIGILASVVLVSFPSATKKAKDARVISAVAQARTVMIYVNSNDGDYDNFQCTTACVCLETTDLPTLCTEISNNAGKDCATNGYASGGTSQCKMITTQNAAAAATAACVFVRLNNGTYFCADSSGKSGVVSGTILPWAATYCVDGTSSVCPPVEG